MSHTPPLHLDLDMWLLSKLLFCEKHWRIIFYILKKIKYFILRFYIKQSKIPYFRVSLFVYIFINKWNENTCHNMICSYSESESNFKVIAELLFKGTKKETSLSDSFSTFASSTVPFSFVWRNMILRCALQHFARRQLKESFVTSRSLSIIEVAYRWTLYCYECRHVPLSGNLFRVLSLEIDIRHSDWQRGKKSTVCFIR